ncbi:MAG: hypothetical protein ACOX0F_11660 [Syntrophomonadaceae bacterium]
MQNEGVILIGNGLPACVYGYDIAGAVIFIAELGQGCAAAFVD